MYSRAKSYFNDNFYLPFVIFSPFYNLFFSRESVSLLNWILVVQHCIVSPYLTICFAVSCMTRRHCPFIFLQFLITLITLSMFYKGHSIRDTSLIYEKIKGQGLVSSKKLRDKKMAPLSEFFVQDNLFSPPVRLGLFTNKIWHLRLFFETQLCAHTKLEVWCVYKGQDYRNFPKN